MPGGPTQEVALRPTQESMLDTLKQQHKASVAKAEWAVSRIVWRRKEIIILTPRPGLFPEMIIGGFEHRSAVHWLGFHSNSCCCIVGQSVDEQGGSRKTRSWKDSQSEVVVTEVGGGSNMFTVCSIWHNQCPETRCSETELCFLMLNGADLFHQPEFKSRYINFLLFF